MAVHLSARYEGAPEYQTMDTPDVNLLTAVAAAEQVVQRLRTLSNSAGPSAQATKFYTRARAKSVGSILEKVERKRIRSKKPQPNYSFRSITDIAGFRVVTLFDDQISTAIDYVLNIITSGIALAEPLFLPYTSSRCFLEAVFVVRSRDESDIYLQAKQHFEQRLINASRVETTTGIGPIELEERGSTKYSSAHLHFNAISYLGQTRLLVPVEFQIRTAVEDVWAEINHKLLYKAEDPYLWSYEYDQKSSAAEIESRVLKKKFDQLTENMHRFQTLSRAAKKELDVSKNRSPRNTRDTFFIRNSFCVSLFFQIGEYKRNDHAGEYFRRYRHLLARLGSEDNKKHQKHESGEGNSEGVQQTLKGIYVQALKCLRAWIAMLGALEPVVARQLKEAQNSPDFAERGKLAAELSLLRQRRRLLELEHLKIRADALMRLRFDFTPGEQNERDGIGRFLDASSEELRAAAASYYQQFCFLLDAFRRDRSAVRPVAMIQFWKHLLATFFSPKIAEKDIEDAHSSLLRDETIPSWSIYQIVIPRAKAVLALYLARVALGYFENGGPKILGMTKFRTQMRDSLTDALSVLVECAYKSAIVIPQRGDIRLGIERHEPIQDLEWICEISRIFQQAFQEFILKGRTELNEKVRNLLENYTEGYILKNVSEESRRLRLLECRRYLVSECGVAQS